MVERRVVRIDSQLYVVLVFDRYYLRDGCYSDSRFDSGCVDIGSET